MSIILNNCLYLSNKTLYRQIDKKAKDILNEYSVSDLIGSNLKNVIKYYAEKNNKCLKILCLPFNDKQVWGYFYNIETIYFIVINSEISLKKQNVALAHEFYHFITASENDDYNVKDIIAENNANDCNDIEDEDKKADAFSASLLMPESLVNKLVTGLITENAPTIVKSLMDTFIVPYKTVIIRLNELSLIEKDITEKLLNDNAIKAYTDRWDNSFNNFIDLDDLNDLIEENKEYCFITPEEATKIAKEVEEIKSKLKNNDW